MSYLGSEFIQQEVEEMQFLQSLVSAMADEAEMTDSVEYLIEYYHTLYALLDKQHVIYTRLSLTDDMEATIMATQLSEEANRIGKEPNISMSQFYSQSKKDIQHELELLGDL